MGVSQRGFSRMICDWFFGVQTRRQSSSRLFCSQSLSWSVLSVKTEREAPATGGCSGTDR